MLTWANVAPRVGAAFDVTGRGRTVVKLFAGRFYWNPSTAIVDDENPVGQAAARFAFHDWNGNRVLDAGPSGGLADSPELGRRIATLGGAGTVTVDPELASPYGHEFSAHFEQQIADDLSFRGSYVYKNTRNLHGIVDMNRALAYRIPVAYTDRGADDIEGPLTIRCLSSSTGHRMSRRTGGTSTRDGTVCRRRMATTTLSKWR